MSNLQTEGWHLKKTTQVGGEEILDTWRGPVDYDNNIWRQVEVTRSTQGQIRVFVEGEADPIFDLTDTDIQESVKFRFSFQDGTLAKYLDDIYGPGKN
jgi:hypothetical protein